MEQGIQDGNSSSLNSVNSGILSQTGFTVLAFIMGMISAAGIILNVLVIVVTVKHRQLRQPLSYPWSTWPSVTWVVHYLEAFLPLSPVQWDTSAWDVWAVSWRVLLWHSLVSQHMDYKKRENSV